jgi:hypothetical protein
VPLYDMSCVVQVPLRSHLPMAVPVMCMAVKEDALHSKHQEVPARDQQQVQGVLGVEVPLGQVNALLQMPSNIAALSSACCLHVGHCEVLRTPCQAVRSVLPACVTCWQPQCKASLHHYDMSFSSPTSLNPVMCTKDGPRQCVLVGPAHTCASWQCGSRCMRPAERKMPPEKELRRPIHHAWLRIPGQAGRHDDGGRQQP